VPGQYGLRIVRKSTICVYSKQQLHSLKVSPSTTVAQVADQIPTSSHSFKLYFEDKELPMTATLQDLGIGEAALLKLVEEESVDSASTGTETSWSMDSTIASSRKLNSVEGSCWDVDLSVYSVPDLRLERCYKFKPAP
jgi:hypothetical protein